MPELIPNMTICYCFYHASAADNGIIFYSLFVHIVTPPLIFQTLIFLPRSLCKDLILYKMGNLIVKLRY